MALEVKLRAPNYPTTAEILLKDARVNMDIIREPTVIAVGNNSITAVDIRKANRIFTIRGVITQEGATSAKTQLENLENAALNWANLTGGGSPANASTFIWSTKNDATDKDYKVYFTRFNVEHISEEVGGQSIFGFTILLTEVGTLSTSG